MSLRRWVAHKKADIFRVWDETQERKGFAFFSNLSVASLISLDPDCSPPTHMRFNAHGCVYTDAYAPNKLRYADCVDKYLTSAAAAARNEETAERSVSWRTLAHYAHCLHLTDENKVVARPAILVLMAHVCLVHGRINEAPNPQRR